MKIGSNRLLRQIQRITSRHVYTDKAVISQREVTGFDDYGQPESVTINKYRVDCSFAYIAASNSAETWKNFADIENVVAEIRFNSPPTPTNKDKIEIVERNNEPSFVDETFEIIAVQNRIPVGFVCALKRVDV